MISEERFQVFVGHLEREVGGTLEKMEDIVGRISKRFGIPEVTLRNTRPLHSKESQALVSLLVRLQSVERTLERVDLELVTVHQKLQNSDGYVRQLEDTIRRRKEAIESLRRKKDLTLEEQKREKQAMLGSAQAQEEQMKKELADLSQKIKELDEYLAANSGDIDIDRATDPKDVRRAQLIQCVAHDMAIEDILYHFDKALLKGVVGLDEYLKLFRQYSNDQFYQRALTKKIHDVFNSQAPR